MDEWPEALDAMFRNVAQVVEDDAKAREAERIALDERRAEASSFLGLTVLPALHELDGALAKHGRHLRLHCRDEPIDHSTVEAVVMEGGRPEYVWRLNIKVSSHHIALAKETGGYDSKTGQLIDGLVRDTFEPESRYTQVGNLLKTDIIWDVLRGYGRYLLMVRP